MTDPTNEPTAVTTDDGATTSGDEAGPVKNGENKGAPRARRVRNTKKGAGRGGGGPSVNGTNAPVNKTDYWRYIKPAFREWLTSITNREEFNGLSVLDRSALLRDFGVSQMGLAPATVVAASTKAVTPEPIKPAISAE